MTKAIARIALGALNIGLTVGNYWFTFGLWPRSWGSFVFFVASQLMVGILYVAVELADH